ncbi:unnamed protein product [Protopolystoma xenopodis]|uniref:Uncharacterized protein n=1 Tax=Protopolystoma xenopodis TaxID=117903 RepID=A0A448WYF5_9PLAT|nr:unnamed protein product [Protopolystoma xenopodis]
MPPPPPVPLFPPSIVSSDRSPTSISGSLTCNSNLPIGLTQLDAQLSSAPVASFGLFIPSEPPPLPPPPVRKGLMRHGASSQMRLQHQYKNPEAAFEEEEDSLPWKQVSSASSIAAGPSSLGISRPRSARLSSRLKRFSSFWRNLYSGGMPSGSSNCTQTPSSGVTSTWQQSQSGNGRINSPYGQDSTSSTLASRQAHIYIQSESNSNSTSAATSSTPMGRANESILSAHMAQSSSGSSSSTTGTMGASSGSSSGSPVRLLFRRSPSGGSASDSVHGCASVDMPIVHPGRNHRPSQNMISQLSPSISNFGCQNGSVSNQMIDGIPVALQSHHSGSTRF